MCNGYDEIDGFIKIQDRIRYLILFGYGWFEEICDKIKYLISERSGITNSINHNFARIRIDSYNSLLIDKILTFIMLQYLLSQLLIRIKMSSTIKYFKKKVYVKINPIRNIFK